MSRWICSQFGGREKYAVPRALSHLGNLKKLYTDCWLRPGALLARLNVRARGRFHPDLKNAEIESFNSTFLRRRFFQYGFLKCHPLDTVFDKLVARDLSPVCNKGDVFFGYSYSSRLSMKAAKSLGYTTMIGQINPGPAEAKIVTVEYKKYAGGIYKPYVPDEPYWDLWREEVEHADFLIVNSEWSRRLLIQEGVQASKCQLIPLAYETCEKFSDRQFPKAFDHKRPLRLLYLGGLELRKGFHILKKAMKSVRHLPVRLDVVGGLKGPPELLKELPVNIFYHGLKAPSLVPSYFKNADILIFPTLSDGFGLTQLEAQSYKLPVITSTHCGDVVTDGTNGIILKKVDEENIVDAIKLLLDDPQLLQAFSMNSVPMEDYSIAALGRRLTNIKK